MPNVSELMGGSSIAVIKTVTQDSPVDLMRLGPCGGSRTETDDATRQPSRVQSSNRETQPASEISRLAFLSLLAGACFPATTQAAIPGEEVLIAQRGWDDDEDESEYREPIDKSTIKDVSGKTTGYQ